MAQLTLEETIAGIRPADAAAQAEATRRWNAIAKPLGSLGLLETEIIRAAGILGTAEVQFGRRAVVVMCADNGVVEEGVTQSGQDVTAIVSENMSRGDTSVCCMSRVAGADVIPVDIGVATPLTGTHILQRNIRRGTRNMAKEPAMTRAEAVAALEVGIHLVCDLKAQGYGLLATGEMGIGNTTSSSALVSVFLGKPPAEVTGRGAGLTRDGVTRKIKAIETAIARNAPDPTDAVDTLAKVGGLDIAGLAGVFLGGAYCHIPVLVDGFISAAAALTAQRLCPAARDAMLGSHASREPAGRMVLDALGLKPFLYADMCLGEGTGAVAVLPLLDMGLAVYREMSTFDEVAIEAYQPLR